MPTDSRDLLQRYLPHRRLFEVAFWVLFWVLQAAINTVVVWMDIDRVNLRFPRWEPLVWEWTSNMVLLALLPAILAFERRFPLRGAVRRHLPWHVLASVVFSVVHVVAMVALRKAIYLAQGMSYEFGSWPRELAYEYLKDARTYVLILALVALYRLVLLRLQGEVRLLDAPDVGPPVGSIDRPERFLVRKLGKEFLLPAQEVEWLQAWGNYVNLRVRSRDYPLRSTLTAVESRLDPARFVRVHRSYIVNLDQIAEIEPTDGGDAKITMKDGSVVPCSRRYRDDLKRSAAAG